MDKLKLLKVLLVVLQCWCASGATLANQQPNVHAERVTTLQRHLLPPKQDQPFSYWWPSPSETTARHFGEPVQRYEEENLVEDEANLRFEKKPKKKSVTAKRNDVDRTEDCKSGYYDEYNNEYICEDDKKEKASRTALALLSLVPAIIAPLLFIAGAALMFPVTITLPTTSGTGGTGGTGATLTGPDTITSRNKRDIGIADSSEEELNSIHRDFLAATEACWERFACESQKAVRNNEFAKNLVKVAFGSDLEENLEADQGPVFKDDDACQLFVCDLSTLFSIN